MREFKFRGKRVDNGEWHYGFYREFTMLSCWKREAYRDGVNYYIDAKGSNESYLVVPETVGQYTEQNDINGDEIYEGMMVHQVSVLVSSPDIDFTGEVKFYDGSWYIDNGKDAVFLFNETCENTIVDEEE